MPNRDSEVRSINPEAEPTNPDLSIDGIRGAAAELQRKVAAAQLAKEQDIEGKVATHDELGAQLQTLRELLPEAQQIRDYFTAVKVAGKLPPDSEGQLKQIEATVEKLESQLAEAERRMNVLASQPDILDRIHEKALTMREGEQKEQRMKDGLAQLIQENEKIVEEVNALAQELQEALSKQGEVNQESGQLEPRIRKLLNTARKGLDYRKHRETLKLLDSGPTPTVEQLQQRRGQLGVFSGGREKGVIDIMLQQADSLRRYHELRDSQQVLETKIWTELQFARQDQLIQRIKNHMIKAWELHEQTGITPDLSYEGIHVPKKVLADLDSRVKALGGIKLVEKRIVGGRVEHKEEVVNDSPQRKQIRDLWDNMNHRGDHIISGFSWSKPSSEAESK